MSTKAVYTTIKNTSGGRKHYYFLPPHGLTLDPLESITFSGELIDRLIPSWPHHTDKYRPPNPRKVKALAEAERDGLIEIVRSLQSPARNKERTLALHRLKGVGTIDTNIFNRFDKEEGV
jgi:hypothetical protein